MGDTLRPRLLGATVVNDVVLDNPDPISHWYAWLRGAECITYGHYRSRRYFLTKRRARRFIDRRAVAAKQPPQEGTS